MRLLKYCLLVMIVCLPPTTQARDPLFAVPDIDRTRSDLATLVLPISLDLQMVDGFVYPGFKNMFRRGDIQVRILPGEREIAVLYNQLYTLSADDHEIVKSQIVVLRFVAEPGKTYRATHEQFRNVEAARAGVRNFVVKIEDAQGANQVIGARQIQKNWRGEETITTRKDLVSTNAAIAAVPAAPTTPATDTVNAVEVLKFTWQNASAAQRAAFMEWVQAQP
ncbi:MAG: DUF2057 family protein [Pseudomonadota bacterium]